MLEVGDLTQVGELIYGLLPKCVGQIPPHSLRDIIELLGFVLRTKVRLNELTLKHTPFAVAGG